MSNYFEALLGSGKQTRFIRVASTEELKRPEIETLLTLAADQGKTLLPTVGSREIIIRSISKKQRPRRRLQR